MRKLISFLIVLVFLFVSCARKPEELKWNYKIDDIVEPATSLTHDSVEIFLFLDATTSMKGFVTNPNSVYNELLDQFESSVQTGWKSVKFRFFKFGTKIKEIDRHQFRQAKTQIYYEEPGIYEKTNIDSVIDFIGSNYKLSQIYIIITDLFQDEADINLVTSKIKENCFSKNISMGILCVKSDFDGMVFDAKVPPYRFKSKPGDVSTYRNLFILMFGSNQNLKHLFETLSGIRYVDKQYFLLISPKLVSYFSVNVSKTKTNIKLTPKSSKKELNLFNFNLKDKISTIPLNVEVEFTTVPYIPEINGQKINLISYRKFVSSDKKFSYDSSLSSDVTIKEITKSGNVIKAIIEVSIQESKGIYSYLIYFLPSVIDGFIIPEWIKEFSSDNPNPQRDPNKTLNLERFISDLIKANVSVNQPKISKFYINFYKF